MMPVARPASEVNRAAHAIVSVLQSAPRYELAKVELKRRVREALAGCTKDVFERGFDRVTQVGWVMRRPSCETGTVTMACLRPLGRAAKVWKP